jgi:signal peptidase I
VEAIVRVQLLLLLPLTLSLIAGAVARGGAWLLLLPPAALLLTGHAHLVARSGLRSWSGAVANLGLVLAATALVGLVIAPHLGLYRPVTVLSGSMGPTFDAGDLIIDTPEPMRDLRIGQVITYQIPVGSHAAESHRVIRILRAGPVPIVQTRGDADRTPDPWQAELHGSTLWRYRLRIPALGYLILALRSPLLHRLTVLALPALLALYGLIAVWRRPSRARPAPAVYARERAA